MEKSLSAFMAQSAIQVENRFYAASKRFVDENKNPIEWEIKKISAAENKKIRKTCFIRVPADNGIKGAKIQEFDVNAYQAKLAAACVVFPDLNNAQLQDSYGVTKAEDLVLTMLMPGEFDDLNTVIMEHNGYIDDTDIVDEAKN